ncbi:MAG: tyrosine--tRNA ligase [Candidatus Levybacteria bacterium CG_4_10_14_0_8_um_filter_35_23]|nr:MAG: tyrosine--tRNA ligase [Candidatus Levybacteria bacterium CG_4_10_14_0_8_um_filter_35_23]
MEESFPGVGKSLLYQRTTIMETITKPIKPINIFRVTLLATKILEVFRLRRLERLAKSCIVISIPKIYPQSQICYTQKIMDKIDELLARGVANIIPNKNALKELLNSGKKLNIYLGIDPTATKIHLGNAVPLRKIQGFAELGHNVTFLIGDFTSLIGDTSDKNSERPILTSKEIEENFKTYKKQAEKIIDFSKVTIRKNSEWLSKLSFEDIVSLMQRFSLNDFISRELIKKRFDEGKRIRLDEVAYPLMQGYDSYFMNTDLQIGGTDQTFNMQAGRTLQKLLRNKESFILTNNFLEGTDGRKMSKSWGNAIWLDDLPNDMYTKAMAINDDLIINYFILATNVPLNEIKEIEKEVKKDPMKAKKKLAFTIVQELHSKEDAGNAAENFKRTVQEKELPSEIENLEAKGNIADALIKLGLSKAESKRLIEQNGITLNNKRVVSIDTQIRNGQILKIGKKKIVRISS